MVIMTKKIMELVVSVIMKFVASQGHAILVFAGVFSSI